LFFFFYRELEQELDRHQREGGLDDLSLEPVLEMLVRQALSSSAQRQ